VHANVGLRWEHLSGCTSGQQLDLTLNFIYTASADTTLHASVARYFCSAVVSEHLRTHRYLDTETVWGGADL
jgi:hypothetical protein